MLFFAIVMIVTRLFEIPYRQQQLFPQADALCMKVDGEWKKYSTNDFIDLSARLASGLLALGLRKDDKVAIISANRPEWNIADIAMQRSGVVSVPLYTTLSDLEIAFILNDSGAQYIFAGDENLFRKVNSIKSQVPSLKNIFTFDKVDGAAQWRSILSDKVDADALKRMEDSIQPGDVATLLYTSGTTGTPKGVMLSHNNILSNVLASEHLLPADHRHRALSFLPLCHSYERMLTYLYMYCGVSIYYAESMEKIADNLRELSPELFSTVPRLLEKVYDRIVGKGRELKGIRRALFFWALDLGLKYETGGRNGWWYDRKLKLANKLIFSKWREALGGNVRAIVSGGAALQPRLARIFWSAGIPVLEGYGLTETSPVIAVNNFEPNGLAFGTVGPVIKNVQVKIADDGEILCKGPNVMLGYYKRPDLTAEVIDEDGWFHTGDIGVMVDNRFLKITDRKKEIFKTSGGKYIAPQALENKFKESELIEQIMIIGENRKFASALIVPSFPALAKWCEEKELRCGSNDEMIAHPEVIAKFKKEVEEYNENFSKTEQVKRFVLLSREWTIETGELTATLKLRRKIIMDKFKDKIEQIYRENGD